MKKCSSWLVVLVISLHTHCSWADAEPGHPGKERMVEQNSLSMVTRMGKRGKKRGQVSPTLDLCQISNKAHTLRTLARSMVLCQLTQGSLDSEDAFPRVTLGESPISTAPLFLRLRSTKPSIVRPSTTQAEHPDPHSHVLGLAFRD